MDRISELPESIVHHILSSLNTLDRSCSTELVRMSVLSKTWFHLTASFPVLYFNIDDFTSRQSFFKYVEYATSRFCHHNLPAHTLKLVTTLRDLADLDIVNGCVERVLNKGVRELVVYLSDFTNPSYDVPKYRLPNILLSVSMSWLRDSTHSKACMYCYPDGCEDKLWFEKLRQFLDKKNGLKVFNLCIHTMYSQKFRELGWLTVIELPPYELEHVELQLESDEESLSHIAFVDAVLCCCRPRSLTLRSFFSFTDFEDVVKFTYKKMLEQEDQGRTNIQIVWPDGNKVCFIKEE
ncbi:hypothetical protein M8C21_000669, partial [Ambrosia artemisiifolia]